MPAGARRGAKASAVTPPAGLRLLEATHQSGRGMQTTFFLPRCRTPKYGEIGEPQTTGNRCQELSPCHVSLIHPDHCRTWIMGSSPADRRRRPSALKATRGPEHHALQPAVPHILQLRNPSPRADASWRAPGGEGKRRHAAGRPAPARGHASVGPRHADDLLLTALSYAKVRRDWRATNHRQPLSRTQPLSRLPNTP